MNRHVTLMGAIYRISNKNFKKYLLAVANGNTHADIGEYGAKYVYQPINVNNITKTWAQGLLEKIYADEERAKP